MTLISIYLVPMSGYLAKRFIQVTCGGNGAEEEKLLVRTAAEKKMVARAKVKLREENKLLNKCYVFNVVLCAFCAWLVATLIAAVASTGEVKEWSPYDILGITTEATDREIKKAYRGMSLIYHPDKNPGNATAAEMFMSVVKAYESLTDEVAKENYRKYGNPDGRSTMEVAIGLPTFLLDKDNHNSILLVYLLGLVVLVPVVVGLYYNHSKKFGEANLMNRSRDIWNLVSARTPDVGVKGLPEILGLAHEYIVDMPPTSEKDDEQIRKFCRELTNSRRGQVAKNGPMTKPKSTVYCADRHPQDQQVFKFAFMMDKNNNVRAAALLEPWMRFRANALIHAHIHQRQLTDSSSKKSWITKGNNAHLDKILRETPRFLEFIMSLFTKMPDYRGPRERPGFGRPKMWSKPAKAVIELSRHMVQALPWNANPLLQMPGFHETSVRAAKKGKGGGKRGEMLNFVHAVLQNGEAEYDAMRSVPGLKDFTETKLREVRSVCKSITEMHIECSFTVAGGEVKAAAEAVAAAEAKAAAAAAAAEEEGAATDAGDEEGDSDEEELTTSKTLADETFIAEQDWVTCTIQVERTNLPLCQHRERREETDAALIVRLLAAYAMVVPVVVVRVLSSTTHIAHRALPTTLPPFLFLSFFPSQEWVLSRAPSGEVKNGTITEIEAAHSPDVRMSLLWNASSLSKVGGSSRSGASASKTASKTADLSSTESMAVGCDASDENVTWVFEAAEDDGWFKIQHEFSGLYLGVRNGSTADGATLDVAPMARWSKLGMGSKSCAQWKVEIRDEDDGDGRAIVSLVCRHSNKPIHRNGCDAPLVYAPRWPMPREENLWLLLCWKLQGEERLFEVAKIRAQSRVSRKEVKFQAPPARDQEYGVVVLVQSDSYIGVDRSVEGSFKSNPIEELPEYIPHQDDIDLDLEPSLYDTMQTAMEDEEESEEEEESDFSEEEDEEDDEDEDEE